MARKPLTRKQIMDAASKYKTRTEFHAGSGGAYHAAKRMGIFDEATAHMGTPATMSASGNVWSNEAIMTEAKRFTNVSDFRRLSKQAYQAASRKRMLPTIRIVYGEPKWGLGKAHTATKAPAQPTISTPAFGTALSSAISAAVVETTMNSLASLHGELQAHAAMGGVPAAVASELAGTMKRLKSITA